MNTFLKLGLVLGLTSLSLYGGSLDGISDEIETGSGIIFTILKIIGFAFIMWGIGNMVGESQGEEKGSQAIKAIVKIVVGGIFMAGEKISDVLGVFA